MRRALLNICISELSRFLYIFNATQTKRGDKCGCAPHVWLRYVIIFVIFMRKLDKVAVGTPYYDHTLNYSLCRRYTMLRTPSNVGRLIVRRIVWPIFNQASIHERQMSSIQRSRWITFRMLSVFLTASKDFSQTFDENIRWFDARLHDLFELQSSFQFLGDCSGGTRLVGY
jgi:hypothetical protein